MKHFMNKPTANPMHNTLRRAIGELDVRQQQVVANNWNTFYQNFSSACDKYIDTRPDAGLYTTGVYATLHACQHMRLMSLDADTLQVFSHLEENMVDKLNAAAEVDTKIEMYWYEFTEEYRGYMPHCNNRILEDLQRMVAKAAHQEYIHNPETDIRIIACNAVQRAAVELIGQHPDNAGIRVDMLHIEKVAPEHKSTILDAYVGPIEPGDLVQYDFEDPEMFIDDMEEEL